MKGLKIADEAIKTVQIITDAKENITYPEIRANALKRFNKTCYVCKSCDGKECRGQVPGMGGVDTGSTFTNNILALEKYLLNVSYIHNAIDPVIKSNIFGYPIETPVLISPVSGTDTNMGGGLSERDYTISILKGAKKASTLAMVGDGTTYEKHLARMRCVKEIGGYIAPIFKPRTDQNEIIQRIHDAEEAGAIAVGIDIDAINLAVMTNKNIKVEPKDVMKLKQLVKSTSLPFIIKGIMSKIDAVRAIDCGAQAIVVSNHGGRILDHMPGTVDVLPEIVEQVHKDITILIDGGFRNGVDILKGLSLGAKYVCLGRPVAIGAMGGEEEGVCFIIKKISRELKEAMRVTGQNSVNKISPHILRSK